MLSMVAISLAILSGCLSKEPASEMPYDEDLLFIYISEMNDNSLNELPLGNLEEDKVSLNEETKNIFFYDKELAPEENTNMMILSEVYEFDTLLTQEVENTNGNEFTQSLVPIEFDESPDAINNEGRLFLNETIEVERVDGSDSIQVSFAGEEFTLDADEHKDFLIEEDDSKSRILIRNYGLWNKENMNYDE